MRGFRVSGFGGLALSSGLNLTNFLELTLDVDLQDGVFRSFCGSVILSGSGI